MKRTREVALPLRTYESTDESRQKRLIRTWQEGERTTVDSLRPEPPGDAFYGQIEDFQSEPTHGHGLLHHLVMECFLASWFDQFADDLSDLPPWNTIAIAGLACVVDLSLGAAQVQQVVSSLDGAVHFHRSAWLRLWLAPRDPNGGAVGVPARIYLPNPGRADPGTIGMSGRETSDYVVTGIRRVRPTSGGLRKLIRLRES
jgi:hypothetical protein